MCTCTRRKEGEKKKYTMEHNPRKLVRLRPVQSIAFLKSMALGSIGILNRPIETLRASDVLISQCCYSSHETLNLRVILDLPTVKRSTRAPASGTCFFFSIQSTFTRCTKYPPDLYVRYGEYKYNLRRGEQFV